MKCDLAVLNLSQWLLQRSIRLTLLVALLSFGLMADGVVQAQGNKGNAPGQNKDENDDDGGGDSGGNGGDKEPEPEPKPPGQYEFELLGTFGGDTSWARGLNSYGDIVGSAADQDGRFRAFLSTVVGAERVLFDLNDLLMLSEADKEDGVHLSFAQDINDLGHIVGVGNRRDSDGKSVGVVFELIPYEDTGAYIYGDLRMIHDAIFDVRAINQWGEVGGQYETEEGQSHAFRLTVDGLFEGLGVLYDDHDRSAAYAINSHGEITGISGRNGGEFRAFLFHPDSGMLDLGAIKSERGGYSHSFAYDVNDTAMVVGTASAGDWKRHAFRWSDGIMEDLGTFGGSLSEGRGINVHGDVVGRAQDADDIYHAFLYLDDFGMIKLEDLVNGLPEGFPLSDRFIHDMRINDKGVIMGNGGRGPDGATLQAYVLTP